jgi:hypothetical protein
MKSLSQNDQTIEWVKEIYVAVFPVPLPGETVKAETILAGYQEDPDNIGFKRIRATVETHLAAVPDLVGMCDTIVEQQQEIESYRLLKFDNDGIHELDPDDFRSVDSLAFHRYPAASWSYC